MWSALLVVDWNRSRSTQGSELTVLCIREHSIGYSCTPAQSNMVITGDCGRHQTCTKSLRGAPCCVFQRFAFSIKIIPLAQTMIPTMCTARHKCLSILVPSVYGMKKMIRLGNRWDVGKDYANKRSDLINHSTRYYILIYNFV